VGEILIEPEARAARGPDGALELTAKEFDLLVLFARAAGRALSRGQILEAVWGDDYEGTERTVDNFVVSLRKKLEQNADDPAHFVTVRGLGYRFDP
jgi:DNA-binding response OmpR family regulator